jgi:flagellar biosynthetic protein FlhB
LVLTAGALAPIEAFDLACQLVFKLALRIALVLLVLGLLDFLYQRWNVTRNLKMTKQEVKDELKRMDGDPQAKQRRRQLQLKLAMQRIGIDVPNADVVVTNPTEFAVALKYDEATMAAPRVTAKGQDLLALRIRQVAQQHGIPIVQRPPLARALYASAEIGRDVPAEFYRAVAEVLAYVYQLSGRAAGAARQAV